VARGGGARGSARSSSGGRDLVEEAWDEGRWCQFGAREVAVDRRTTLGGGDWTGLSPEWAGDGEAPTIEEVDDGLVVVTPRVSKPHDYANHMFMRL
jgi:hypothetical protein